MNVAFLTSSVPIHAKEIWQHVEAMCRQGEWFENRDWLLRTKSSPLFIRLTSDNEHELFFSSLRAIMDVLVTRSILKELRLPLCHVILENNYFPIMMLTVLECGPVWCPSLEQVWTVWFGFKLFFLKRSRPLPLHRWSSDSEKIDRWPFVKSTKERTSIWRPVELSLKRWPYMVADYIRKAAG